VLVATALLALALPSSDALAHNPSNFYDLRWPAYSGLTTVEYSVASGRSAGGFPSSEFRRRLQKAAERYNRRNRNIRFTRGPSYTGRATPEACLRSGGKRVNLVRYGAVDKRPRGVIALTHRCISNGRAGDRSYPRHIQSFTTTFDAEEDWYTGTGGPRGRTDFSSVAVHELGHGLGAGHYSGSTTLCNDGLTQQSMCLNYIRGASRQRSLAAHDVHTFDAAYPSPIWWADAERPGRSSRTWEREWSSTSSLECFQEKRARVVTSHGGVTPAQGNRFYALTTTDRDQHIPDSTYGVYGLDGVNESGQEEWRSERCELGHGNPPNPEQSFPGFREGDEAWFSFWVRFPTGFKTQIPSTDDVCEAKGGPLPDRGYHNFLLVAQWKQGANPPTLGLTPSGDRLCLNTRTPSGSRINYPFAQFKTGEWLPFTLHVKFSSGTGQVELCGNPGDGGGFRQLVGPAAAGSLYSGGSPLHQRIGVYRGHQNHNGDQTVYFDGWTVATTRSTAESNAFPDLATPAGICSAGATGSYALP
jgi:hypothetical protein